jgi:uncharacterized protein YndB with AHSA1/START domain
MLYALFCYADEAKMSALPRETMNALVESHVRYDYELIRTEEPGRVLAERWLKPSATGMTVRSGPAGESRAVVAPAEATSDALTMFYLLNCESQDEAIRLASRYPWLDYGHVEVRPVMGEWDYAPSIDTAATPAQVWRAYEDVDSWLLWYPGAADVHLAGDLVEGVRGKVTTTQGQVLPIRVISVDRGTGFVTETRIADDCTLQVRHTLAEQPGGSGGCRITHQAVIPRRALDLLGMDFSKTFNQELRDSLQALTSIAERITP